MNRKIIVATHGKLASGLKDSISMITGISNIDDVCCFCEDINDPEDIKGKIIELINNKDGETIIFTDLFGGSVNRTISQLLGTNQNLHIITGINLATILELVCSSGETTELISSAIKAGKNDIKYMNSLMKDENQ